MKSISQDEVLKVMKCAGKTGLRNQTMILLGYLHGMRASEVCELKLSDLLMDREQVVIRRKKGSLTTTADFIDVPGQPLLCEKRMLRKWLAERGDDSSPFVFPSQKGQCLDRRSFFGIFQSAAREAGLPVDKQHCHVLKHALGYRLVEQGRSMPEIRRALGHRSIQSTAVYTEISDAMASKAVAAAIAGYGR